MTAERSTDNMEALINSGIYNPEPEWGSCEKCDADIDFRGYCTNPDCWYHTRFQQEVRK